MHVRYISMHKMAAYTHPSIKSTLTWWEGLWTKRFQQRVSTRRGPLSVTVTTTRLNEFSLLLCQDKSKCWLGKTRKAFSRKKNKPSQCSASSTILSLCWFRMASQVSQEEGSYASHFYYCFFRNFIRIVFYFLWLCLD